MLPHVNVKPTRNSALRERNETTTSFSQSVLSVHDTARIVPEPDPEGNIQYTAEARLGSKPLDAPRAGYDEYGAELNPNARIWPAYVREAEAWDEEMVDGWNRSLDVMLIFTALFSAVATTFVVESFKNLQPDPSQTSADALLEITLLLRAMSNGSNVSTVNARSDPSAFSPSTAAIWINALWFLSLALSVSVSLVVMLAKQWCYSYMAGRSGQPHVQARARQRRLEELQGWKMPEILDFLPILIHLSLFLFFIGLIVNLWDSHVGVAAPVLTTTAITVLFYSVTTVLPITYELCPYNTPLSRFLKGSPGRIKWLRSMITGSCLQAAKKVANPKGTLANIRFTLQFFLSGTHRRRHRQRERERKDPDELGEPDADSIMDNLTSRALGWLLTHSQDTRSVDAALQAIAGADTRLPTGPLLNCGAHTLLAQRFRGCFISHPQSGFSFLKNLTSADAASLYGRALEVFMGDSRHFGEVDRVLKRGHGGGFAIRRAYQCLQYDLGRTRPNLAAFGLSGVSTWWQMRSHAGQLFPGVLKEALVMLERHITSESTLHPVALVTVVDKISAESQVWMHKLSPRERASYPMVLLDLLNQLDEVSLAQARPAVATCLASFSFAIPRLTPSALSQPGNADPSGLAFLYNYNLDDARARDVEPLLVYGLLSLLRDRAAYELDDPDIGAIARQIGLVHTVAPPPSGITLWFVQPPTDLNATAIQTLLDMLGQPLVPDTSAEILKALMPYSYAFGTKSNTAYTTIAAALRTNSDAVKSAWNTWLDTEWSVYYTSDMLERLQSSRTFERLIALLAERELDRPAVPFAMRHILSMLDQVLKFGRRSPMHAGNMLHRQLLISLGAQLARGGQEEGAVNITSTAPTPTELVRMLTEAWIPLLEEIKGQVPEDILNSGVLDHMLGIDALGYQSERLDNLLRHCHTDVS